METPYTVPEIARLTGIPETTLYDYVRQFTGIVPEVESAEENGRPRRRYPEQAIAVFQTIRHLKDRGVDLPTIRALLQEERTPEGRAGEPVPADALENRMEAAPTLVEPAAEPEVEVEETLESVTATVADETATASEETSSEETARGDEAPEPTVAVAEEPILRGLIAEYPFFEAPSHEPAPVVSVSVEPVTPLDPAVVVENEAVPAQAAFAATLEPATAPSSNGAAPSPAVDGEIVALQGHLLGGIEERLRSLRSLINTQNSDNLRLMGELKEQRDENERLRATIRYQKDQTRSAERLLAAIKTQCEQGIQTIAE
jgi:DNA-binding transcriptional MerR regulator